MYIKAKYPKTYRWYMNIETQGFGADSGQNSSSVSNVDTSHSVNEDRASTFPS